MYTVDIVIIKGPQVEDQKVVLLFIQMMHSSFFYILIGI